MTLNLQQSRKLERLRRAVFDARAAGLYLVADADGQCIRVTTTAEEKRLTDLRTIERTIDLDGGCGGGFGETGIGTFTR